MIEVEAKIKIEDSASLRARLEEIRATHTGSEMQHDIYLNAPHRDFALTDEALRVRSTDTVAEVTYKGPKYHGSGMKARDEINLSVESGERFIEIMQRVGFVRAAEVRKQRDSYTWKGTRIALDMVEGLGSFVEIEAITDGDIQDAVRLIEEVQKDIRVKGPHITRSYLELLLSTR
jgi:adenylate cyclase class 2